MYLERHDHPCEGIARVSFPGVRGVYLISIVARSDSHRVPSAPPEQHSVDAQ
jgi:hypothetical protein